jgi:predicted porin
METEQMSRIKLAITAGAAAAACLAASGSASAQGNVRLYGVLDLFAGSSKPSGSDQRSTVIDSGGMTTSYWGITGSEELGGNLKATFVLESYVRLDTGAAGRSDADPLFTRSAWVGLTGALGEVRIGRQINPVFSATVLFDPTIGSTRFSPVLNQLWTVPFGRVISGDTTRPNSIGYYSPPVGGLRASIVYSLGEQPGTNSMNNTSGMLLYREGPFAAALAAQEVKFGPGISAANPTEKLYVAGVSYDLAVVKLFGQYDKKKATGVTIDSDTYSVGASIPVGASGKILTSYATTRNSTAGAPDYRRDSALIGYDYALSKRTDVYANFLYDKLRSASNTGSLIGIGVKHNF